MIRGIIFLINFVYISLNEHLHPLARTYVTKPQNYSLSNLNNTEWMKRKESIDHIHRLYLIKTTHHTKNEYLSLLRNDHFMKEFAYRHSKEEGKNANAHKKLEEYFFERYVNYRETINEIHTDPSRIRNDFHNMQDIIKDYAGDSLQKFEENRRHTMKCEEELIKGHKLKKELNEKVL